MLRAFALGLIFFCTGLTSAGLAQTGDKTELTLDQARQLAVHALQSGRPGLAIELSRGLLRADRRDPLAYYVIAQAHAGLNQPNLARRAATRAYRFSDNKAARFQAGQLAARMAYSEGKPSLAQVWLRRTAIHAPSRQAEAAVARDYQALRAINPWSFRLRGDIRPSDNINNGADSAVQIIDGIPFPGNLSGAALALSGVIASLDLAATYRLRADERSRTSLGGRIYLQRVDLSGGAIALAPNVRNSDYSSTYAELSLRHGFAVGPAASGGAVSVELAIGESWFAGRRSYRFGRLKARRTWQLGQGRAQLSLDGSAERRTLDSKARARTRLRTNDAHILGLGAQISRKLGNGDSLGVTLALRDADARHHNGTFRSASLRTSYAFARPLGPARLSLGLLMGYSDYPTYQSGVFFVPGGKQEKSVYADLTLFFEDYDLAGFAPVVRLRTGRKSSNDSRFNTREFSISLSIQSKF